MHLEGAVDGHIDVGGLVVRQHRQLGAQLRQVQRRDLSISPHIVLSISPHTLFLWTSAIPNQPEKCQLTEK